MSPTSGGGAPAASVPAGGGGSAGALAIPFGGDVSQSLTAADLDPVATDGYALQSSKASDGVGGPNSQCTYHMVNATGGFTEPAVSFLPLASWDLDKSMAQKDASFQQLSGLGDDAYASFGMGTEILSLKAKGYYIDISGVQVGGFDKVPALEKLATALAARLP
ncbi:MAG TPA: hypothetical protein VMT50_01955 [Steroidobacteraceae bacterium]|nr:hypothetical protein [Steroidobacteraceae bacterium]